MGGLGLKDGGCLRLALLKGPRTRYTREDLNRYTASSGCLMKDADPCLDGYCGPQRLEPFF